MLTKEKLDSWYTPVNTMEQEEQPTIMDAIEAQIEEDGICPDCLGEGWVTIQTAPDDDYTRRCHCNLEDEGDMDE